MADIKEKYFNCPLDVTMTLLGGKWKCSILWHLRKGPRRFNQLKKKLPGVTPKMLTQQLRDLEDNDIINRKIYPVVPPKVEYTLTPYGQTFLPIIHSMYRWGKSYSKDHDVYVDYPVTQKKEEAI